MNLPSADEIKGRWKQKIGAAKIAWGKLTEDELLKLEGHEEKLAGLIQERYAITRDEADRQVKSVARRSGCECATIRMEIGDRSHVSMPALIDAGKGYVSG